MRYVEVDDDIFKIIESLITVKGSSAWVEIMCSSFGLVQSKLRNRLGN